MSEALLKELARVKALFQQRSILAAMGIEQKPDPKLIQQLIERGRCDPS